MSIIHKHIPRQSDIDKIVKNIETCVIHSLELPIQAQDLIKAYQHSTHFHDIYQYITDGKLPSSVKAQNCIRAKALNYVVINNFLFRIDMQKDRDLDKGNLFLLVIPEKYEPKNSSLPFSSNTESLRLSFIQSISLSVIFLLMSSGSNQGYLSSEVDFFMLSTGNFVHMIMCGISAGWIGFLYANGDGLNVAGVILS